MLLIDLLQTPAYTGLSDADALALASVQTITESPTAVYVTYQKLRALWNMTKADTALAVVKQADPNGAQLLFTIGVDVNFPDTKALLAALPTLTGGAVTVADCDLVRNLARTITYPTGDAPPTLEQVQDARAVIARLAPILVLEQANRDRYNAAFDQLSQLRNNTSPIPATLAEIDAMESVGGEA